MDEVVRDCAACAAVELIAFEVEVRRADKAAVVDEPEPVREPLPEKVGGLIVERFLPAWRLCAEGEYISLILVCACGDDIITRGLIND